MAQWLLVLLALAPAAPGGPRRGAAAAAAGGLRRRRGAGRWPPLAVLRPRRPPRRRPRCRCPSPPAPRGESPQVAMPSGFGRALIEKLPTPLLIVSRSGRVSYANPRGARGAAAAAARRAFRQPDPRPGLRRGGRRHPRRRRASAGCASPPTRGASASSRRGSALLPPDGAFGPEALAIVQIEDRTETRRAEQLRSDFIANASHELRTPLASIIGYIETLQNHARDDPEARERFLGIMAREAGRMQRLVDDLMSLSRIEMTEHLRPVEEWSLNQIAAESAAALLPVAAPARGDAGDRPAAPRRRAGARRPRPARAGLHQPDRQRDEVRRRGRDGAGLRRAGRARRTRTATASPSRTTARASRASTSTG